MSSITGKANEMIQRLGYFALQYVCLVGHWKWRLVSTQNRKRKRRAAQKNLEKTFSGLGGEIYAYHKQGGGKANWQDTPGVKQQLQLVEEAESKVFEVDAEIEEMKDQYRAKKEELKARFSAKRSAVGGETSAKQQDS